MTNCDAPVFHGRVDRTCAKRVQSNRSQHSQSLGRADHERMRRRFGWCMSRPAWMFISRAYSAISS